MTDNRPHPEPLLATVKETADILGYSERLVWGMLAAGELPSIKYGRTRRIPRASIQAWVDRKTAESDTQQSA